MTTSSRIGPCQCSTLAISPDTNRLLSDRPTQRAQSSQHKQILCSCILVPIIVQHEICMQYVLMHQWVGPAVGMRNPSVHCFRCGTLPRIRYNTTAKRGNSLSTSCFDVLASLSPFLILSRIASKGKSQCLYKKSL